MNNILLNLFLFLCTYGFVCVAVDLGHAIGGLAIRIDKRSLQRTLNLVGTAVLAHEFQRLNAKPSALDEYRIAIAMTERVMGANVVIPE